MKSEESFNRLPSYAESISSGPYSTTTPNDVQGARAALVLSILTTHITPHLQSKIALSSKTFILVPSDISHLQPPKDSSSQDVSDLVAAFPGEMLVGFRSSENLTMIRLQGPENRSEFWRQQAAIQELEQQLRTNLRQRGYRVINAENLKGKTPRVDWRSVEEEPLGSGEVRIGAETKEICLRIENKMGLYENRTGKAVVLKIDVER